MDWFEKEKEWRLQQFKEIMLPNQPISFLRTLLESYQNRNTPIDLEYKKCIEEELRRR